VQAGRDTFVETLSAYEMVARGFHEVREDALVERRQAALVRRLSTFLADTSLTVEGDESLAEMLHLVAEHARELLAASRCEASLVAGAGDVTAVAVAGSPSPGGGPGAAEQRMQADLETLAGRRLGRLEVVRVEGPAFSDADCAVLMHIAQMTSGAVERSLPYHRRTASRAGR
jgi:GAF domain-containing protein